MTKQNPFLRLALRGERNAGLKKSGKWFLFYEQELRRFSGRSSWISSLTLLSCSAPLLDNPPDCGDPNANCNHVMMVQRSEWRK